MPRKGENIFKRKDGRWEGRYIKGRSQQGKAVYGYVYSKNYFDVKKKLCTAIACQSAGNEHQNLLSVSRTFGSLSLDWLKSVQPQVKDSTYMKYRNLTNSYVIPEFGAVSVSAMTSNCISDHCNHLLVYGGRHEAGLSAKTVADVISIVRRVLRYSQQAGITAPCTGEEVTIKQTPKELCVLTRAEQITLHQHLAENPSEKNLGILICLLMGLRIGEICALKWEDISLQENTIHIHHTMQRIQIEGDSDRKTAVIVTTPKSACSIRTIPIPDSVQQMISRHFLNRHGYLLTGCDGKQIEPRTLQNYFKRVLKETGIKPVNFHALRHTFATRCVEVGFDVKCLSEILGHANVNITMNRYVHPSMELKKENMQRLSDVFLVR